MCLVALVYRVVEDAPLVIGANREEFFDRGGEPPQLLEAPHAVAGLDPRAGGTWLGINAHGVVVAVTNRRKSHVRRTPRSRGLLCRQLLACTSAAEAAALAAREVQTNAYNGCNLLCADVNDVVVLQAGDWLRVRPLPPGIHVLANRDVNDPSDPRVVHACAWLLQQRFARSSQVLTFLQNLCASHEPAAEPMCFHAAERGTVSSTLLALRPDLATSTLLHAQGAPDVVPYVDRSCLLAQLAEPEK